MPADLLWILSAMIRSRDKALTEGQRQSYEDKGGASGRMTLHVMTAITEGPPPSCENQDQSYAASVLSSS